MRTILFFAGVSAMAAWVFMILVGIVHTLWLINMPTIGYGNSLFLILCVDGLALVTAGVLWLWAWITGDFT